MGFKRTIVLISVFLFAMMLVFMVFFMSRSDGNVVYPPVISNCPDYWDHDEVANTCNNTFGMKKDAEPETVAVPDKKLDDFLSGTGGKCMRRDWAQENGVTWDGITNNKRLDCSAY
jgi:hypothetical protein